jgi:cytochrome c6
MFFAKPSKKCLYHATIILVAVLFNTSVMTAVHAGNYFKGKTIYATYCQSCHGSGGTGELSVAPNFTRGQGLMKPDAILFETVNNGRNIMPAFRGVLKNEDIYDVISYIRSFH